MTTKAAVIVWLSLLATDSFLDVFCARPATYQTEDRR